VSDNRIAPQAPVDAGNATQRTRVIRGLAGQLDGAMTERYDNGSHVEIIFLAQEVLR
jgi:hypothetical protein